ncbi:hypothetical protein ACNKHU_13870 [Shigella flexneri]
MREAPRLESEKQRDWFFWRQKRGAVVAGRMSAEEGKKICPWAQSWLAADWRCAVTNRAAAAGADPRLGNAKVTSQLAAGANGGATGKQPDGRALNGQASL